jgi:hypothetical protein
LVESDALYGGDAEACILVGRPQAVYVMLVQGSPAKGTTFAGISFFIVGENDLDLGIGAAEPAQVLKYREVG